MLITCYKVSNVSAHVNGSCTACQYKDLREGFSNIGLTIGLWINNLHIQFGEDLVLNKTLLCKLWGYTN